MSDNVGKWSVEKRGDILTGGEKGGIRCKKLRITGASLSVHICLSLHLRQHHATRKSNEMKRVSRTAWCLLCDVDLVIKLPRYFVNFPYKKTFYCHILHKVRTQNAKHKGNSHVDCFAMAAKLSINFFILM